MKKGVMNKVVVSFTVLYSHISVIHLNNVIASADSGYIMVNGVRAFLLGCISRI